MGESDQVLDSREEVAGRRKRRMDYANGAWHGRVQRTVMRDLEPYLEEVELV